MKPNPQITASEIIERTEQVIEIQGQIEERLKSSISPYLTVSSDAQQTLADAWWKCHDPETGEALADEDSQVSLAAVQELIKAKDDFDKETAIAVETVGDLNNYRGTEFPEEMIGLLEDNLKISYDRFMIALAKVMDLDGIAVDPSAAGLGLYALNKLKSITNGQEDGWTFGLVSLGGRKLSPGEPGVAAIVQEAESLTDQVRLAMQSGSSNLEEMSDRSAELYRQLQSLADPDTQSEQSAETGE